MRSPLKYTKAALVLFAIWTAVGLTFSGVGYLAMVSEGRAESPSLVLTVSLIRSYVWGLFSPVIFLFARWMPIDPRQIKWRNVAGNAAVGLVVSFLYSLIFLAFGGFSERNSSADLPAGIAFAQRVLVPTAYTVFSLYAPTFFTIQALLFYRNFKEEAARNATLQSELSSAQLNALKMQLQPHFLFNSLHSISSLIIVDPKRANEMVALLGDFLRQTLEHSNDQMVALSEEIDFLRCYLEIEKTRFEDRLTVHFDIDPDVGQSLVPHMILQPLVENAVKHGIAPYEAKGAISVSARRQGDKLSVCIENTGERSNKTSSGGVVTSNGVGIANVRSRLDHMFGPDASLTIVELDEGGCRVDLSLPLRKGFDDIH